MSAATEGGAQPAARAVEPRPVGGDRYLKLAAVVVASATLLLIAAFLYDEQAATYKNEPYVVAVFLQMVYETPFQPLFLVIALLPVLWAAARNASWIALAAGGLMLLSLVLPYARFLAIDASLPTGPEPAGFHNSLFQLAGPGHRMPQFVSIVTLMLMGGLVALFWHPRVGGLIGLIGAITMIFVWPAAYDDPPTRGGEAEVIFFGRGLLFGYYLAWAGAAVGIVAPWIAQLMKRSRSTRSAAQGPDTVGA
ncbi:MAG: hypothetical protein HY682_02565 [Chloroflexi bacterium]|nr:hypothetical protein [Chloroflexota bacterium]